MADFCAQCSEDHFGADFGDLKGLCGKTEFALTICEGCGIIQVDHKGNCVSEDCLEKGHKRSPKGALPSKDR